MITIHELLLPWAIYQKTFDNEKNRKKTFAITVLAEAIVSSGIIYFGCQKRKLATEPFATDAPQPPVAQSVPMPIEVSARWSTVETNMNIWLFDN